MRKHVHGLKRDNAIAVAADSGQLAGERLRITGDVGRPARFETAKDFTQDRRIGTVESWGLPEVFRQIRNGAAQDMFARAAAP